MRILVSKKEDPVVLAKYGWDKPLQKKPNQMGWRVHFNVFQVNFFSKKNFIFLRQRI